MARARRHAAHESLALYGDNEVQACVDRRPMGHLDSEWQRKDATLSDKTGRKSVG
jgi:hypothetical protein